MILPRFGKREKFLALSFFLSGLFLLHYLLPYNFWPVLLFIVLLFQAIGIRFIFRLRFKYQDLAFFVFPSFFCLGIGFVQYLFPHTSFWFRALLLSGFFFCLYITLLALNIFWVARKRGEIPLLRPARTALFLETVLIFFLNSSAILKGVSFLSLQVILLFLLTFFLSLASFFFLRFEEKTIFPTVLPSLLLGFLVLEVLLSLSFFPQKSFFRALSLAAVFYAFLGVGDAYFAHRLEKKISFDFFLIFALGMALFWLFPR